MSVIFSPPFISLVSSDVPAYPAVLFIVLGDVFYIPLEVCRLDPVTRGDVFWPSDVVPDLLNPVIVIYVLDKYPTLEYGHLIVLQ
jgi:hypothetical protein